MKSAVIDSCHPPKFDSSGSIPQHIAIIMDGNRRWAKAKGLPILEGHRQGVKALRRTSETLRDIGVKYLTVFAFSTENKNRPADEVSGLMHLILYSLKKELAEIHANGIQLRFIGERDSLSVEVRDMVEYAENLTRNNAEFFMTVGLNYGSHADLAQAAKKIASMAQNHTIELDAITPDLITQHLSTAHLPCPDLLIRTSGVQRLSNFLLWELSYSEIVFIDHHWPDFDKNEVLYSLSEFQSRQRRYGL